MNRFLKLLVLFLMGTHIARNLAGPLGNPPVQPSLAPSKENKTILLPPPPNTKPVNTTLPKSASHPLWPATTEVLASSSQREHSFFNEQNGSYYTHHLLNNMVNNHFSSLGEAHAHLGEHAYLSSGNRRQYPVSSADLESGWCLEGWNRDNPMKTRYAILLAGVGRGQEIFQKDCEQMRTFLQDTYKLDGKHILYYPNATSQQIEKALKKIQNKTKGSNPDSMEVLLYYSGHGSNLSPGRSTDIPPKEGEDIGLLSLKDGYFAEPQLKSALENNLPDINTHIIIDTCHAGAWIA